MRERLTRTGHTVHGLPEVRTVRIGNLMTAPPVFCPPERIGPRSRQLDERSTTSRRCWSREAGEFGIVTDTDFRHKVVAGGVVARSA